MSFVWTIVPTVRRGGWWGGVGEVRGEADQRALSAMSVMAEMMLPVLTLVADTRPDCRT